MKSIKVDEAAGTTLDWLVATCVGHKPVFTSHWVTPVSEDTPRRVCVLMPSWVQPYEPSRNWAVGGPIIERENISLASQSTRWAEFWQADIRHSSKFTQWDHKPLIAAMRCYVMSKLGETVEVPEELLNASHLTN